MPSTIALTRTSVPRQLKHHLFNRKAKAVQRGRLPPTIPADLHTTVARQLLERRQFIKRESPVILEVGAGAYLPTLLEAGATKGIRQYIQTDISEVRLNAVYERVKDRIPPTMDFVQLVCDEETPVEPNPFGIPERSVDMAISCLSMHWVNDLERVLVAIRRTLRRDAFLLLSMLGGNTLYELRSSHTLTVCEAKGGMGALVSPMVDGAGMSQLMLQSGYALPAIDMDRHVLMYKSALHLMEHLQDMGESACHSVRSPLTRQSLIATAAVYDHMYMKGNVVPATFEVFHSVGWSPSPDQPKPLPRGSGAIPLGTISTSTHRNLQNTLEKFAKDPNNKDLQEEAERLMQELNEMAATPEEQLPTPTEIPPRPTPPSERS